MLDKFLAQLPKNMLALLAIGGGIFLILVLNPPYTICDSQMSSFREAQLGFVHLDPKDKVKKTSDFDLQVERCKATNSPGGCYELFLKLKTMLKDLNSIPKNCSSVAAADSKIRRVVWDSLDLIVRLAWGQKPPETYYEKFGWLEPPDILLYCQLKRAAERVFGRSQWESFRERMFRELPGANQLNRSKAWEMMLISTNCDSYR